MCFQKGTFTAVPGCEGGENDASKTDYCVKDPGSNPSPTPPPQTLRPTPAPQSTTPRPTLQPANGMVHYLGNGTCAEFLFEIEGSLNLDLMLPSHCLTHIFLLMLCNLLCYGSSDGWPASAFPLPVCGGDCDRDSDCAGNLVCFQRNRFDAVPGCTGGESDTSFTDYCIHPPGGPQPTMPRPSPRPTYAPQMTPRPSTMPTNRPTQAPQTAPTGTTMIEFLGNGK